MESRHLQFPSQKSSPILAVLIACCLGMACAGAIPKSNHNRLNDTPTSDAATKTSVDSHQSENQKVTQSEVKNISFWQRALLKKGRRPQENAVADYAQDNQTVAQRVVRRSTVRYCSVPERVTVYHPGQCRVINGLNFCDADSRMDLGNPDCTDTSR